MDAEAILALAAAINRLAEAIEEASTFLGNQIGDQVSAMDDLAERLTETAGH